MYFLWKTEQTKIVAGSFDWLMLHTSNDIVDIGGIVSPVRYVIYHLPDSGFQIYIWQCSPFYQKMSGSRPELQYVCSMQGICHLKSCYVSILTVSLVMLHFSIVSAYVNVNFFLYNFRLWFLRENTGKDALNRWRLNTKNGVCISRSVSHWREQQWPAL